jgi:hypothetical protein
MRNQIFFLVLVKSSEHNNSSNDMIFVYRLDILIEFDFWCFNATFSNISAISLRPVLVVEEVGVPGENHRPWASN